MVRCKAWIEKIPDSPTEINPRACQLLNRSKAAITCDCLNYKYYSFKFVLQLLLAIVFHTANKPVQIYYAFAQLMLLIKTTLACQNFHGVVVALRTFMF